MLKFFLPLLFVFSLQAKEEKATTILFLGDSLTAGYGLKQELAFPSLIEKKLNKTKKKVKVINAGISGSTTAGSLKRLKWYMKAKPELLFLALGANDGLRGLDLKQSQNNLEETIQYANEKGLVVILAGMKLPPNYGKEYREKFEKMFKALAKKYKVDFIPFLLEGVGGNPELNQADGIHPNEKGQEIIAQTVLKKLKGLL